MRVYLYIKYKKQKRKKCALDFSNTGSLKRHQNNM